MYICVFICVHAGAQVIKMETDTVIDMDTEMDMDMDTDMDLDTGHKLLDYRTIPYDRWSLKSLKMFKLIIRFMQY
jgi:hypothetical protein